MKRIIFSRWGILTVAVIIVIVCKVAVFLTDKEPSWKP